VTFQNRDTFVEFIVDTVNDLSFSFLPLGVDLTLVHQLILLALCDDNNRSMTVYLATDNDNDNNDNSHLIIERRLHTNTDRLNISVSGVYLVHIFGYNSTHNFIIFTHPSPAIGSEMH